MSGSWGLRPDIRKCLRRFLEKVNMELWKQVDGGEVMEKSTGGHGRAQEGTGGYGRVWEGTGEHGRVREGAGGHGRAREHRSRTGGMHRAMKVPG